MRSWRRGWRVGRLEFWRARRDAGDCARRLATRRPQPNPLPHLPTLTSIRVPLLTPTPPTLTQPSTTSDSAIRFDRSQPLIPARRQSRHPACGLVELFGPHREADLAAGAPGLHEPSAIEHCEVLEHRDAADRQLAGQRRRGSLAALREQREHAPARRVRQRAEDRR